MLGAHLKVSSLLCNHFSFCHSSITYRSDVLIESWRPSFSENVYWANPNHIIKNVSPPLDFKLYPQDMAECLHKVGRDHFMEHNWNIVFLTLNSGTRIFM